MIKEDGGKKKLEKMPKSRDMSFVITSYLLLDQL